MTRHSAGIQFDLSDISIEMINPTLAPERELEITDDLIEMQQYIRQRAEAYRLQPADTLLSKLVHVELDGERLNPRELISIMHQLLVAGNETTTNAIGTGIWMLLEHQEVRAQLETEPTLMANFVEEVLRLHAPSPHLYRQVLADTEIGGVPIAKNSVLILSYLAANHDEHKFSCPEDIDLKRPNARQHMAFGRGIHFCIGNQLARAEMRVAFARLLARLPRLALDPEQPLPRFATIYHTRGLENLHTVF